MTVSRHHRRHLDRRHRRLFTDHGRIVFKFDNRALSASQLPTDAGPSAVFGSDDDNPNRRYAVAAFLAPPAAILSAVALTGDNRPDCEPTWFVTAFCEHIRDDVPLEPIMTAEEAAHLHSMFAEHPTHWLIIAIGRESQL